MDNKNSSYCAAYSHALSVIQRNIYNAVKTYQLEKNLTFNQLAEFLQVSNSQLSKIFNYKANLTLKSINNICTKINCNPILNIIPNKNKYLKNTSSLSTQVSKREEIFLFTEKLLRSELHSKESAKLLHYQSHSIINTNNNNLKLSKRQLECWFYLLRGKTAKEIGKILNVSFRTIEAHIEQLKFKFDCSARSMLIEKAIIAGYMHDIPETLLEKKQPSKEPKS